MYFFAFNLEKFTPDRIFYTASARGACDKYEVWTHVGDNFPNLTFSQHAFPPRHLCYHTAPALVCGECCQNSSYYVLSHRPLPLNPQHQLNMGRQWCLTTPLILFLDASVRNCPDITILNSPFCLCLFVLLYFCLFFFCLFVLFSSFCPCQILKWHRLTDDGYQV